MLGRFAAFEFRYQALSPMFFIVSTVFFLLAVLQMMVPEAANILSAGTNHNSPYIVAMMTMSLSLYAIIIPTVMLSSVVLRDRHFNTEALFFTKPVSEFDYLVGRFIGAFGACAAAFLVVPLGMMLGAAAPWLDQTNIGPFRPLDYLYAYVVCGLANLLITGALLFTVANLTRSLLATYTALLGFLVLYVGVSLAFTEPEHRLLAAMLDPYGGYAFEEQTRYWSPFERDTQLPFGWVVLANRLVWLGGAAALLVLNVTRFSFQAKGVPFRLPGRRRVELAPAAARGGARQQVRVTPSFGAAAARRQFLTRLRFEIMFMLKSISFWSLLAFGVLLVVAVAFMSKLPLFGTPVLPTTRVMMQQASNAFVLIPIIVLIFFAGELVWRERVLRAHEIIDATPTPSWVFVFAKLIAMWVMVAALFGVGMLTAIVMQIAMGGTQIEWGVYPLQMMLVGPYSFYLLATLSMFAQVIANNRFVGMLLMVGYMIATAVLGNLGLDHVLYRFAAAPGAPYSDMNGFGHFLVGRFWVSLYWTLFCGMLVVATFLLWNRGAPAAFWNRPVRARMAPATLGALGVLLIAFAATGSFIFYNTNVLNPYFTPGQLRQIGFAYEADYRQYEDLALPRVTDVSVEMDIYPRERRYEARGVFVMENKTDAPIETVPVDFNYGTTRHDHSIEGAQLTTEDEPQGFYVWTLDQPMAPGERRELTFDIARDNVGFRNSGNASSVLWNGSFVNKAESLPRIGFNRGKMVSNPGRRRGRGLEPLERLPKLEDTDAAADNYIGGPADWVNFETTVSTSADQIAVAPGQLIDQWDEGDRRYFRYEMQSPILDFYAFLSARYAVEERTENGILLQVFHHPPHDYNVERMLDAMADAIDYYSEAFSPFQHGQMRIFEFPHIFGTFAQSFPNFVPYSEGAGFIMDGRDPDQIDYVYYITAHEVAHQWWAHQLVGANMQGATMLSETFAQYSALMLMEKEFGEHQIRRFLQYELDQYLIGRAAEPQAELPLYRVENQPYIHYQKGSLVMYALKDYLGEATVNRALARFLDEYAYQTDPYPRSTDFLSILRDEAGPEHDMLITDLFEKIVLFDLSASDLQVAERADGRFDVTLTVQATKLEADEEGRETEVPIDYMIDIGVFSEDPADVTEGDDHVLALEKRRVTDGENVFRFVVDAEPEMAGIDPYNKLVDRASGDNMRGVDGDDPEGAAAAEGDQAMRAAGGAG